MIEIKTEGPFCWIKAMVIYISRAIMKRKPEIYHIKRDGWFVEYAYQE